MPRFTVGARSRGSRLEYCQRRSPVAASMACTLSPKPCTNITPSCTSGTTSFGPFGSAQLQARRRSATLCRSICVSGLKPMLSADRRHVSQSPSAGVVSMRSVTVVIRSSGFSRAGGGGMGTPVVRPPLGPPAAPGMAAPRRTAASTDSSRLVAVTPFSCARYARICARTASPRLFGAVGGIRSTSSCRASSGLPPKRSRNSTPLSGGANSPSSRLVPWHDAQLRW